MKINIINEFRVEMELEESEMRNFDITFDELDYGDINTRKFLRELAESAKNSGVNADMSGRVLIEAFKIQNGCRVCFTFLPSENRDTPSVKQLIKKEETCICIRENSLVKLIDFCKRIDGKPVSTLWKEKNGYVLFVFASADELKRCAQTADEFFLNYYSGKELHLYHYRETACLITENATAGALGIRE